MTIEQLVATARRTLRVLTWSPSRFAKWKECPAKVLYEDLMKMCPRCFKGRIKGGFDGVPVTCDTCDEEQPKREMLDRGNRLDAALTIRVQGGGEGTAADVALLGNDAEGAEDREKVIDDAVVAHRESFAEATRHPGVQAFVKKLTKTKTKTKNVKTQEKIVLDSKWNRVSQFTKNAWARLTLDVLVLTPKVAKVYDWKSGNIDNKTGEIREKTEYHDSMRSYQLAVLSSFPQAEASAEMVFLDAEPKSKIFSKSLPVLKRKDLSIERERWEQKIKPMLLDDQFAPRSGYYCNWCDFSKRKGGPCPY